MKCLSLFSNNYAGKTCLAATLLLSFISLSGQPLLSLEEACLRGLRNNYSVRIARNDSVMAEGEVTYGNAGMLPVLTMTGSWDRASLDARVKTVAGGEIDRKGAAANLLSAGLQASWTLFDGTAMFVQYDKLRSQAKMSSLDLTVQMENTLSDITEAYCDLIRQRQMLEACRKKLEVSDLRLEVARTRYQSGLGSEQEMLQAEVIRLADSTGVTRQWTRQKQAGLRLNKLMAVDLNEQFLPEDTVRLLSLPSLEQLLGHAFRTNGLYLREGEQRLINGLEVRLLRSRQLPRLTLRGSWGFTENETGASFINFSRTFGPQAGITASLTLFDGMNLTRRLRRATLELENQELRLKELEQELAALILEGWYEHESLLEMVNLGKEGLRIAGKNMAIASDAFAAGMASSLQLREAQEDLFRAHASLVDVLYQARVMETELLRLSGMLLAAPGEHP